MWRENAHETYRAMAAPWHRIPDGIESYLRGRPQKTGVDVHWGESP